VNVVSYFARLLVGEPVCSPVCKYHPTCSRYASDAIRKYGPVRGSLKAAWRLLRCNPWSHGGVDYA
jgi:putative membrane protein insertion efficiency factor